MCNWRRVDHICPHVTYEYMDVKGKTHCNEYISGNPCSHPVGFEANVKEIKNDGLPCGSCAEAYKRAADAKAAEEQKQKQQAPQGGRGHGAGGAGHGGASGSHSRGGASGGQSHGGAGAGAGKSSGAGKTKPSAGRGTGRGAKR